MILSSLIALIVSGPLLLHPTPPGVAVNAAPLGGFPLNIRNDTSLYRILKPGIVEAGAHLFRFPDGDLSNEYHWNGTGDWGVDSVWIPSETDWSPGFQGEIRHRGTSKNVYGVQRPSLICDGDTATFWWSNPDHPDAPGWYYVDFGKSETVDSLAILMDNFRPDSVQILKWTGLDEMYPGPHQQPAGWVEVARSAVTAQTGIKLSVAMRYLAVRPLGSLAKGWRVKEFKAFKSGSMVTKNVNNQAGQTQVVAISAHPSSRVRTDFDSPWNFGTYADWIANLPGADPMICVNYGSGTPKEAAAWVRYANKVRKCGIRRWEVGNEIAGPWEDGGPVNARQYAIRFLKYSKEMKLVDPKIAIYGPVWGSTFREDASGNFDGRSWMEGFLQVVDSAERHDNFRYLDGIDFHSYPYWFASTPNRNDMLRSIDESGKQFDTLLGLMAGSISSPLSREITMSEYNSSTLNTSMFREASAGSGAGLLLAHFVQRFGDRGGAVLWNLFGDGTLGPDGTYGTLAAFNRPAPQNYSNLGFPPNGTYWPMRTILREWLDPAGGDTIVPVDQLSSVRLFAVINNGRRSVIAFNLGPDSANVALDPTSLAGGDQLSWGTGEYTWHGTGKDGFAYPDNGPSSRILPISWDGKFKVPPYGFVVVRTRRTTGAARNAYIFADKKTISIEDTLRLSGWSFAEGDRLKPGYWLVKSTSEGLLHPTDGEWDGPMESWTAAIPASSIGIGSRMLKIVVPTLVGQSLTDSIPIEVLGSLRPVLLVSNFDANSRITAFGKAWYLATGDTGTRSTASLRNTGGFTVPYLHVATTIAQGAQAYLNFQSTIFETSVPAIRGPSKDFAGLSFDYRADLAGTGQTLRISVESSPVRDYNYHALSLPATGSFWVNKVVRLSDLQQADWGKPTFPVVPDSINHVVFRIDGVGPATLDLDEVYLLGTKGSLSTTGIALAEPRPRRDLQANGKTLSVNASGDWTLRIHTPDGRIELAQTGRGAASIQLPESSMTSWAVLASASGRYVLALPPVSR